MELEKITVTKDGKPLIKNAKGKTDNGRVIVMSDPPAELKAGDKVAITASGDFETGAMYMGEDPGDVLNFKID